MYVKFFKENDSYAGHAISQNDDFPERLGDSKPVDQEPSQENHSEFSDILYQFESDFEMYEAPIAATFDFNKHLGRMLVDKEFVEFIKLNCVEVSDDTFEVSAGLEREILAKSDMIRAWSGARSELPRVAIIGLIATLDNYIARLAKIVCNKYPYAVFSKDKSVPYTELISLGNIDDLKNYIVDQEVEKLMRDSHDAHVLWFEKALKINIISEYPLWSEFMEICARRNLFTHASGVVSSTYLALGKKHGYPLKDRAVGGRLYAGPTYYRRALHVVFDFFLKLTHVVWRKVDDTTIEEADENLLMTGFDLITKRRYKQSIDIFEFGLKLRSISSDRIRRMYAINLSNAYKLGGNEKESRRVLDEFDWSAVGVDFKVCIAGIKNDTDEVVRIMKIHGRGDGGLHIDYENWPVFENVRQDSKFRESFKEKFGNELPFPRISAKTVEIKTSDVDQSSKAMGPSAIENNQWPHDEGVN